jgi:hypothetical protein
MLEASSWSVRREMSPRLESGKWEVGERSSIRLRKQIADTQPVTKKKSDGYSGSGRDAGDGWLPFWVSRWGIGVFGFGFSFLLVDLAWLFSSPPDSCCVVCVCVSYVCENTKFAWAEARCRGKKGVPLFRFSFFHPPESCWAWFFIFLGSFIYLSILERFACWPRSGRGVGVGVSMWDGTWGWV